MSKPTISPTPLHFTIYGNHPVCRNPAARRFTFDPEDTDISCDRCNLWLAGYRAGKADR